MSYIPNTDAQRHEMLKAAGVQNFDELFERAVPRKLWDNTEFKMPPPLSELEVSVLLNELSSKNICTSEIISFIGAGVYNHYMPAAVNALLFRSEFYTAYTPYQAEVAQGTLQSIFEYQTMVSEILGMEVSNASMYDGATACAEAALIASAHTGRNKILVPRTLHPNYAAVTSTYLSGLPIAVDTLPASDGLIDIESAMKMIDDKTAAVLIQQPNFLGLLEDVEPIIESAHKAGALAVMVVDPITLGVLKSPGEYGADIAVAEGQPFGIPQAFGGPLLGMMAVNKNLVRRLPGRLVGKTIDSRGNEGFCLTLQTREQHIRRNKATSNICTNQALCALAATIYLSLLGPGGLKHLGELALENSHYAYDKAVNIKGFSSKFDSPFFREFVVETSVKPSKLIEKALLKGILPGVDLSVFDIGLDNCLMLAFTEMTGKTQIDKLVQVLSGL
ncbi:MAG: aminomethyl-transferring glycine dehydrogenase [candidate division Zixibacteria bacterium CG_4_9_14_3_um_filter_46_8]|nr:MAG: aminomethyl-transferring glycine dehydrogenase [candidate division Zixibacteria bacterium CG_4_9_14_3_um_filter_46_8]